MFSTKVTSDGADIRAFTGVQVGRLRLGVLDTMTITVWDPPRECRVLHTGRLIRGDGIFGVLPRAEGASTFHWREELDLPFGALGRLGWPILRPFMLAGVRLSLRRFARWAQREAPGARSA
jgi:hypothetical protein